MAKKQKESVVKLTPDEIKDLTGIRSTFSNITFALGENEITFANIKLRKEELMKRLSKIQEKQNEFSVKLEDKYGKGNVNVDTGEFTPTNV